MQNKIITVTKPHLPELDEFIPLLSEIWSSGWLTNCGPMHQRLELELASHLGVPYVCLFNNATIALLVALQALDVRGDVITTPFSFVATAHSLRWHGNNPVFVDIDPITLNLDPSLIEGAITEKTSALMPVHCYGTPCNVDEIERIARKHKLKVIYDAAHAFGVEQDGRSILNHGDLSVVSFHATKVFNTFEGGAIVCQTIDMKRKIDSLKNFGIQDELTVTDIGINGKMAEINAAFGLLQLKTVDTSIRHRKEIAELYSELLKQTPGITYVQRNAVAKLNYGYYPILIDAPYPISRDDLYLELKKFGIFSRRYFYPLISNLPMYSISSSVNNGLNVASEKSEKILCLPIYSELSTKDVKYIADIIRGN